MQVDELPSFNFHVSPETVTSVVAAEFGKRPDLPGAMVVHNRQLAGVLPRRRLEEHMRRPFGQEALAARPLSIVLKSLRGKPLLLEGERSIHEAAEAVLARDDEFVFDPFVVKRPDGAVRLVDVRELLRAMATRVASSESSRPLASMPTTATSTDTNTPKPVDSPAGGSASSAVAKSEPVAADSRESESLGAEVAYSEAAGVDEAVSRATAFEQMGGDAEMVKQIGQMVVDMCPAWVEDMQDALERGDAAKLKLLAHSLKSSADRFGAEATVQAAFEVERRAGNGDLAGAAESFEQLRREFARFLPAIRRLVDEVEQPVSQGAPTNGPNP